MSPIVFCRVAEIGDGKKITDLIHSGQSGNWQREIDLVFKKRIFEAPRGHGRLLDESQIGFYAYVIKSQFVFFAISDVSASFWPAVKFTEKLSNKFDPSLVMDLEMEMQKFNCKTIKTQELYDIYRRLDDLGDASGEFEPLLDNHRDAEEGRRNEGQRDELNDRVLNNLYCLCLLVILFILIIAAIILSVVMSRS